MPIYEYACPEHGLFTRKRNVKKAGRRAACPQCRTACPREYGSVQIVKPSENVVRTPAPPETEPPWSSIERVTVKDCTGGGMVIGESCRNLTFIDCNFSDNGGPGVHVLGGKGHRFINTRTSGNTGGGIVARGDAEVSIEGDSDIR